VCYRWDWGRDPPNLTAQMAAGEGDQAERGRLKGRHCRVRTGNAHAVAMAVLAPRVTPPPLVLVPERARGCSRMAQGAVAMDEIVAGAVG
jgi:hypothetical protein